MIILGEPELNVEAESGDVEFNMHWCMGFVWFCVFLATGAC
jgi:hypothetical protein